MRNSANAVSEPSEYICISCWTPFEGTPDEKSEITCPHCAFVQPAGSDSTTSSAGASGSMTMQDVRAPWLDKDGSDEPIAFDNLEQLEQLLGNSGQSAPVVQSSQKEAPPPPPVAEAPGESPPTIQADFELVGKADSEPASVLQAITSEAGPTIWRLKSDVGMTYSFFSLTSLVRWADGLAPQDKAALTSDGVVWKRLGDFRSELEKNDNLTEAFDAAPLPQVAAATTAKATTTGSTSRPNKSKANARESSQSTSKNRRASEK